MAESTGERSFKPTPKRLRDARRRGQVARSRELASAVALAAATGVLAWFGGGALGRLRASLVESLGSLDAAARQPLSSGDLSSMVSSGAAVLALTAGPVAVAAGIAGVAASVAQGGLTFSLAPLQPDPSRLSPVTGLRRLKPSQAGLDTLRAILAVTVLAVLAWRVGRELALDAPRLAGAGLPSSAARGWDVLLRLLWQAAAALLAFGAVDYAVQRWRLMSSLKMTRQEVQEEARSEEGRPEVKARVRRIQRDMVRRRMLHAVPRATVVITNPTHYAVALEYRREKSAAPVVVAKGRHLLAARIREIARAHNVPVVENPPLARALYAEAEVGEMIPAPLFGAVAEVLAYLIRIRQLML